MGSAVYKYLFPFVIIVGVSLCVLRAYIYIAPTTVWAPSVLVASPTLARNPTLEIAGTIRIDTQDPAARIPYIFFTTEKGTTMAKQLIFAGGRGCSTLAGDLPCAGVRDYGAYPNLDTDDHVIVTGTIVDDRFFVETLRIL